MIFINYTPMLSYKMNGLMHFWLNDVRVFCLQKAIKKKCIEKHKVKNVIKIIYDALWWYNMTLIQHVGFFFPSLSETQTVHCMNNSYMSAEIREIQYLLCFHQYSWTSIFVDAKSCSFVDMDNCGQWHYQINHCQFFSWFNIWVCG